MCNLKFDVVVIGSGFGSAPIALRLAEKGYKVVVIEKGPSVDPKKDYQQSQKIEYLQQYYKQYDGKNFGVTAVEALGGGSGLYLGISLRTPSYIFNKKDTKGNNYWPKNLRRKTLDPYYEKAETMLKVHQVPSTEVSKNGQLFSKMMSDMGYTSDRTRLAVEDCRKCGFCVTGCTYDAKQSLLLNYIPRAQRQGVTFLTSAEAQEIKPIEGDQTYKYHVHVRLGNQDTMSIDAKAVTLGGGTVGSAKLLMQSRKNLPKISKTLGETLTGNVFYTAFGKLPKHMKDGEMFIGNGLPGTMSYQFLESHNILLIPYKTLPIQMFARVRLTLEDEKGKKHWWGPHHAKLMQSFRKRVFILTATSFLNQSAKMTLNKKNEVKINFNINHHTKQNHKNNRKLMHKLLEKSGLVTIDSSVVNWEGKAFKNIHYNTTHPLGSARMADDIKSGVVDSNGEVFNYKNLFVSDGAAIPSSLIVPPSLTILANAERIAEKVIDRLTH